MFYNTLPIPRLFEHRSPDATTTDIQGNTRLIEHGAPRYRIGTKQYLRMRAGHVCRVRQSTKSIMERKLSEKQLTVLKQHQFKKGEVQQPQGRTTPNKINQQIREVLSLAVQDNLPAVNKAIDSLLNTDDLFIKGRGVELYLKLLEFSLPRLQAVAVKGEGMNTGIIVVGKPAELDLPTDSIEDAITLNEHGDE